MQATLSQYGARPFIDDVQSKQTKYKTNLDLTSEMDASIVQEPAIIKKENRRKFRNAKDEICNFFQNLTKSKHQRSKSGDNPKNIPFQLLMSNFRRKKILETLKNKKISFEEKNEILQPYEEYIERVLDQYQEQEVESGYSQSNHNTFSRYLKNGIENTLSLADKMIPEESQSESEFSNNNYKQAQLDALKAKISNLNFSEVLNAAKLAQMEAKAHGLVNFGPKLAKVSMT